MTDRPPISPECPQLREDAAGTAPQRPGSDTQGEPNKRRPSFTAAQRLEVFERFGAFICCQADGCENVMAIKGCAIDHWLALIDGGKHEFENFRPICEDCHKPKSAGEHVANWKAKRNAAETQLHRAVMAGEAERQASRMKSRGFQKHPTLKITVGGRLVKRG